MHFCSGAVQSLGRVEVVHDLTLKVGVEKTTPALFPLDAEPMQVVFWGQIWGRFASGAELLLDLLVRLTWIAGNDDLSRRGH